MSGSVFSIPIGFVQSKSDDFGVTIKSSGVANVAAQNMKINTINVGFKNAGSWSD